MFMTLLPPLLDTGNFDKTRVNNHYPENRLESLLLCFYKTTIIKTAVTENIAVQFNNATELFWKAKLSLFESLNQSERNRCSIYCSEIN